MSLPRHLVVNIAMAVPLKYAFDWSAGQVAIFVLWGSILIDIDHILYLALKYQTASLWKWLAIGTKLREKMQAELYVFHSPEFNLALAVSSAFSALGLVIFLGSACHVLLDMLEHYQYHRSFRWMRRWSIICTFWRILNSRRPAQAQIID